MSLKDIKVGDEVFVVNQNSRYRNRENLPPVTYSAFVTKVGRQYGYIGDKKFSLDTGYSQHPPDSNARVNGYGFDVYISQEAYEKKLWDRLNYDRLKDRLVSRGWTGLIELPPSAVEAIHAILDEHQID